jgi:hypothetical protein
MLAVDIFLIFALSWLSMVTRRRRFHLISLAALLLAVWAGVVALHILLAGGLNYLLQ